MNADVIIVFVIRFHYSRLLYKLTGNYYHLVNVNRQQFTSVCAQVSTVSVLTSKFQAHSYFAKPYFVNEFEFSSTLTLPPRFFVKQCSHLHVRSCRRLL